jgi:hypothetical protein
MNNIREEIVSVITSFLKGKCDIVSFKDNLDNILRECKPGHRSEKKICQDIIQIVQNHGYGFFISIQNYKYLQRTACFLKTSFEVETVKVVRFSQWNFLALMLTFVYLLLFKLGVGYRFMACALSLILMNCDFFNPIYEPLPPLKYKYHPFKSKNEWLQHKHFLKDLKIEEKFDLNKFSIKRTIFKNICIWAWEVLACPVIIFIFVFPQRCNYLIQRDEDINIK